MKDLLVELKRLGKLFLWNTVAVVCLLLAGWSWLSIEEIKNTDPYCKTLVNSFFPCSTTSTNHYEFLVLAVLLVFVAIGIWVHLFLKARKEKNPVVNDTVIMPSGDKPETQEKSETL